MAELLLEQRLLTADEYHAMGRAGILDPDERVELLDGKIVPMSSVGGPHITIVNQLTRFFARSLPDNVEVSVRNPVRLDPHWEPEPDLALIRPLPGQVPTADRVLLLIEVADTTIRRDREVKLPRYAMAGVPEVWIVNLPEGRLEVYRQPEEGQYAERCALGAGDRVRPQTLPEVEALDVRDVFGPFVDEDDG